MKKKFKVFVVSLSRAQERRRMMVRQLSKLSIPYEFIDAIDAETITEKEVDEINLLRHRPAPLTRGQIACARSHAKACSAIDDLEEEEFGVVLEDDVLLSKHIKVLLDNLANAPLPDVIWLAVTAVRPVNIRRERLVAADSYIVHLDPISSIYGTMGYCVSKCAAKRLSLNLESNRTVADDWKLHVATGAISTTAALFPLPVLHAELISQVNHGTSARRSVFAHLKKIIYAAKLFPLYHLWLWRRRGVFQGSCRLDCV